MCHLSDCDPTQHPMERDNSPYGGGPQGEVADAATTCACAAVCLATAQQVAVAMEAEAKEAARTATEASQVAATLAEEASQAALRAQSMMQLAEKASNLCQRLARLATEMSPATGVLQPDGSGACTCVQCKQGQST